MWAVMRTLECCALPTPRNVLRVTELSHWGAHTVTFWQGSLASRSPCAVGDEPGSASSAPECGQMQICTNKERCAAETVKYTRTNTGKCELLMKNVLEVP